MQWLLLPYLLQVLQFRGQGVTELVMPRFHLVSWVQHTESQCPTSSLTLWQSWLTIQPAKQSTIRSTQLNI